MTDELDEKTTGNEEGSVKLVGTAHVSQESVDRVTQKIEDEQPDMVAVELDQNRYKQIQGEQPDDIDPKDVISGNTAYQFLIYWMLSYVQSRLGEQFDVEPGADMKAAIDTAERFDIPVALVDRDIQVTVKRFWKQLGFGAKFEMAGTLLTQSEDPKVIGPGMGFGFGFVLALFASIMGGPYIVPTGYIPGILTSALDFLTVGLLIGIPLSSVMTVYLLRRHRGREKVEALEKIESLDDIEQLTETDMVTALMDEFRRFSPGGAAALIDERDAYIAHKLITLRDTELNPNIVAVVGAGHQKGIQKYLDNPETLPPFEELTENKSSRDWRISPYRVIGYLFTLGFAVFFGLLVLAVITGVEGVSTTLLIQLFGMWFLINGIFAFTAAKLAGARWSSAAVGGSVAWLTSVNPMLAPGWFAGYAELRHTKVNVTDISQLNDILNEGAESFRELWKKLQSVPLFKLIAVVIATNLGSFVASILFLTIVVPIAFSGAGIDGISDMGGIMIEAARNGFELIINTVR